MNCILKSLPESEILLRRCWISSIVKSEVAGIPETLPQPSVLRGSETEQETSVKTFAHFQLSHSLFGVFTLPVAQFFYICYPGANFRSIKKNSKCSFTLTHFIREIFVCIKKKSLQSLEKSHK